MATHYLEEFATEAEFLARSADRSKKLGIGSIDGEYVVVNKSGSVVELVDETRTQTLTNKTLTSPVINGPMGAGPVEVVTTTNVITAAESGTTFILNSATAFVSTLPLIAAGLFFRFIIGATPPSGGNHTVVSSDASNIIYGGATVAGADVPASAEDSINFIDGGLPGDQVDVYCDGTNWYVNGRCTTAAKLTFTAV